MTLPANLLTAPLPEKSGQRTVWSKLHGSARSLAILSALKQHTQGPVLIVTPDTLTANKLIDELDFFQATQHCPLLTYPDWETLPYDKFSPHQDIISERLKTLNQLPHLEQAALVLPVNSLMQHIAPRDFIQRYSFFLDVGDQLKLDVLRKRLESIGFRCVNQVFEHGEFAVRGSIIDLFPMGSQKPYRIELFDDEVDSIRTFDVDTQRSLEKISEICILPAKEFPTDEEGITTFRESWRNVFFGNPLKCPMYTHVSDGIFTPGVEYYLPLFFKETDTFLDHLPKNTLILRFDIGDPIKQFQAEINERYQQLSHDITRPILEPQKLFLNEQQLFEKMNQFQQVFITSENVEHKPSAGKYRFATAPLPNLSLQHTSKNPLSQLQNFLTNTAHKVLLCTETAGRRETLLNLLRDHQIKPRPVDNWQNFFESNEKFAITLGSLDKGVILEELNTAIITETELFGERVMQQRRRQKSEASENFETSIDTLAQLTPNTPVVHFEHGIGRYIGLTTLDMNQQTSEFLCLEYANQDKLYVPITSLHLISQYSGASPENAPLHRLGSGQWEKAKEKAAKRVHDVAAELLDIYAMRTAKKGFSFNVPDDDYRQFALEFPFEETPDQENAIKHVIEDMKKPQPMDRLICGDVGFGKTEVAMRAAFIAASNNKQICVLVPTTLLAQQHFETFSDRFANLPIQIDMLSRFRSAKEQKKITEELYTGQIDIVIGTHKLLQENIKFKNLGLIIIDEEHRFGVRQKERLKALRTEVDILTLTATPIPRTLNMALSSIRDLSIIATPPAKRLSIKTFVQPYEKNLIRESILREIMRGGQVYFLHNEVATIENMAGKLEEIIPEANITVAHGQMRERELEQVMSDFYHHRFNVLLCSTIIETGIDIPSANTIIIHRADKFGLAQLHQLRGRVGRSHHQAYAYLLTPPEKPITKDAQKRLDVLTSSDQLGAGFTLAMHDLEIRGAGEFLGQEQSGNIQEIGFTLYNEMLERAVSAIRQGKTLDTAKPLRLHTEINLQISALIPDTFVPDVHTRLQYYKRIASARDTASLDDIQAEMIDRFGFLPLELKHLFQVTELKQFAESLGIQKIECTASSGRLDFTKEPKINPAAIIQLIQSKPETYQLNGPTRLRFTLKDPAPEKRIQTLNQLLTRLSP